MREPTWLAALPSALLLFGPPLAADGNEPDAGPPEDEAELTAAIAADAANPAPAAGTAPARQAVVADEDPLNLVLPQVGSSRVLGNEQNPQLSVILDVAGAWFSTEDRLRTGGHDPVRNGPALQGVELAVSAPIDPYFRFDMNFCFVHLHLEEAYLTTTSLPWNLQLRAGQFYAGVGRHNATHPHSWHFVNHPLPNQFLLGAEGLTAPGAELSYLFPLPWYAELSGALLAGGGGAFADLSLVSGDPGFDRFTYPVRLEQFFDLSDDVALQLGLSALFGASAHGPEAGNRSYAYGGDLFLKWRPIGWGRTGYTYLAWETEGWFREMEVAQDLWRDAGGWTALIFGLDKRWELGARGELWRRVSGADVNPEIERGDYGADTWRASGQVAFLPSHFSKLRLQYTWQRVDGFEDTHIALLQLEVSAGAHGAHAY